MSRATEPRYEFPPPHPVADRRTESQAPRSIDGASMMTAATGGRSDAPRHCQW
jgi:hypothetical protein